MVEQIVTAEQAVIGQQMMMMIAQQGVGAQLRKLAQRRVIIKQTVMVGPEVTTKQTTTGQQRMMN